MQDLCFVFLNVCLSRASVRARNIFRFYWAAFYAMWSWLSQICPSVCL